MTKRAVPKYKGPKTRLHEWAECTMCSGEGEIHKPLGRMVLTGGKDYKMSQMLQGRVGRDANTADAQKAGRKREQAIRKGKPSSRLNTR